MFTQDELQQMKFAIQRGDSITTADGGTLQGKEALDYYVAASNSQFDPVATNNLIAQYQADSAAAAAAAADQARTTEALGTLAVAVISQETQSQTLIRQLTGVDTRETPVKQNIDPHIVGIETPVIAPTIIDTPAAPAPAPADEKKKSLGPIAALAAAAWYFW